MAFPSPWYGNTFERSRLIAFLSVDRLDGWRNTGGEQKGGTKIFTLAKKIRFFQCVKVGTFNEPGRTIDLGFLPWYLKEGGGGGKKGKKSEKRKRREEEKRE